MKGKLVCFVAVILLLAAAGMVVFALAMAEGRRSLRDSEIVFSDIGFSDTAFEAAVWITSSFVSFRKYTYDIQGDALDITVYGGLAGRKYPNGNFVININDDLREVNNVRLKSGSIATVIFVR